MRRPEPKTELTRTPDLFALAPLPVAKLDDRGRLACLRLIRSENVGPVTFRELINLFGGAEAALTALPELVRRGGRAKPIRICPSAEAEAELAAAHKAGARPIITIEPGYPAALAHAEVPPPLLYVKGDAGHLARPMVGIVGSRDCSAAGQQLTRMLAQGIAAGGYVIVSGLARGIDRCAHEAALATGTVAVLAGGIDIVYPPEHERLQAEIAERGVLVSERPPGYKPQGRDFPRRNRIIAGVSLGVVIVEAARRSGSLGTARLAAEMGREVFAVPGHPLDSRAEGTNGLLRNGATLTTCAADVLQTLAPMTSAPSARDWDAPAGAEAATAPQPPPSHRPPPSLTDPARRAILQALGPAPVAIDVLARAAGLPVQAVQAGLMELDLAGRIVRHGQALVSLSVAVDRDA